MSSPVESTVQHDPSEGSLLSFAPRQARTPSSTTLLVDSDNIEIHPCGGSVVILGLQVGVPDLSGSPSDVLWVGSSAETVSRFDAL